MNSQPFYKYHGTGNDFIIFHELPAISTDQIVALCDRKYGIGADGIILMHKGEANHFEMMYYNSDGTESFCGNGSRCSVAHANHLGWINNKCTFNSNDGLHEAHIDNELVHLKMHNVKNVGTNFQNFIVNTGSPHFVKFVDDLDMDIIVPAKEIRYSPPFKDKGINVNFCKPTIESLNIRTYERGVEDETLSCGTGVTAAVLAEYVRNSKRDKNYARKVETQGGELAVSFEKTTNGFENIYLIGPAVQVFMGTIEL